MNANEMNNLREAIKSRYAGLRETDEEDFPTLYYKSTVEPYEYLIKSIKKHVSRNAPVPTAKTFSKVFHDNYPIKNAALLDTLYRYAFLMDRQKYMNLYSELLISNESIEVSIEDPITGQHVDRILKATGTIHNGSNLWLVVRPSVSFNYWVQKEPKIYPNGTWEAFVHIGSIDPSDLGVSYEICAFVHPKIPLSVGSVLNEWPEALKASSIIKVIRR